MQKSLLLIDLRMIVCLFRPDPDYQCTDVNSFPLFPLLSQQQNISLINNHPNIVSRSEKQFACLHQNTNKVQRCCESLCEKTELFSFLMIGCYVKFSIFSCLYTVQNHAKFTIEILKNFSARRLGFIERKHSILFRNIVKLLVDITYSKNLHYRKQITI